MIILIKSKKFPLFYGDVLASTGVLKQEKRAEVRTLP